MTGIYLTQVVAFLMSGAIGFGIGWALKRDLQDAAEVREIAARGRHERSWPRKNLATTGELAELYQYGWPQWDGQSWHEFREYMENH